MAIEFECPECSSRLRVADEKAGTHGRCPHCQSPINVPGLDERHGSSRDEWMNEVTSDDTTEPSPHQPDGSTDTPLHERRSPETYHSKTTLVWTITVLMGLFMLSTLAMAAATGFQLSLLKQLKDGQDVPQGQLELSDALVAAPACVYLLVYLALGVVWCVWKASCNRNARALSGKDLEYTPGWCAGCYFVPVANLVWPYNAMKEIWENSDPSSPSALVGVWWGLWILNNVVSYVVTKISLNAETLDELITADTIDLIIAPLDLASAAVALLLVWKLHGLQQRAAGQT